jgi:hypothetical protein
MSNLVGDTSLSTYPGHTERSVYGSERTKFGIFTALRTLSFTMIRLSYIYVLITEGFWSRY